MSQHQPYILPPPPRLPQHEPYVLPPPVSMMDYDALARRYGGEIAPLAPVVPSWQGEPGRGLDVMTQGLAGRTGRERRQMLPSRPIGAGMERTQPLPHYYPRRSFREAAKDWGITAGRALLGLPEAAIGVAELNPADVLARAAVKRLTGRQVPSLGESVERAGASPSAAKEALSAYYSEQVQRENRTVAEAEGFVDTAVAAGQNLGAVFRIVVESLPVMVAGAGLGGAATRAALGVRRLTGAARYAAGAVGEGSAAAGMQAEAIRRDVGDLTIGGATAAGTSGVLTGFLSRLGGRVADKLGIADVDTLLAAGMKNETAGRNFATALAFGAVQEGLLEEFPQSMQEQIFQNMATGKDLLEGVPHQGVLGLFVGGLMGPGAQLAGRAARVPGRPPSVDPGLPRAAAPGPVRAAQPPLAAPAAAQAPIGPPVVPEAAVAPSVRRIDPVVSPPVDMPGQPVGAVGGVSAGTGPPALSPARTPVTAAAAPFARARRVKRDGTFVWTHEDAPGRTYKTKQAAAKAASQKAAMVPLVQPQDVTNEEADELTRVLDEMETFRYSPRTFTEVQGQGGTKEVTAGAGGASVFADILGGTRSETQSAVISKVQDFLETGTRSVISDLAMDVVRRRLAGDRSVSRPQLPPEAAAYQAPSEMGDMGDLPLPPIPPIPPTMGEPSLPGAEGLAEELSTATLGAVADAPFALQPEAAHQGAVQPALSGEAEPVWQMSRTRYQAQTGVHRPFIGEISGQQRARMSKAETRRYDQKRQREWDASAAVYGRYRTEIMDAYDRGEVSMDDASGDARDVIHGVVLERRQAESAANLKRGLEDNRIASPAEVATGDRVFDLMRGRYATVGRRFKKSVRLSDGVSEWTAPAGQLQWRSYDDAKATVEAGDPVRPARELPALTESARGAIDRFEDAARTRLKDRGTWGGSTVTSGIDPLDMVDLTAIGASRVARGAVDFGAWSAQMVKDFGEQIRPHLQKIWEQARAKAGTIVEDTLQAVPAFYGGIERAVASYLPKRANVQQVKKAVAKGGIPNEELEWSGLETWLEGRKMVTRDEVQEFLAANQLRVEEVTLGEPDIDEIGRIDDENQVLSDEYARLQRESQSANASDERMDNIQRRQRDISADMEANNVRRGQSNRPTKFSDYVLAGGENYRELLITLPRAGLDENQKRMISFLTRKNEALALEHSDLMGQKADLAGWTTPEQKEQLDRITVRMDEIRREDSSNIRDIEGLRSVARAQSFTGGHFDEPNVLAHVRFNERTDSKGRKVLFVEEVQSDWHQEGRKHGYRAPPLRREDVEARFVDGSVPAEGHDPRNYPGYWEAFDRRNGQFITRGPSETEVVRQAMAFGPQGAVPDAPFKTTWPELAMKRMLRYAADSGADVLAWTTGSQQVERYDDALRKAVDRIEWTKTPKGVQLVGQKVRYEPRGTLRVSSPSDGRFYVQNERGGIENGSDTNNPYEGFSTQLAALEWIRDEGDKPHYAEVVNTTEQESVLSDAIGKAMAKQILESSEQSGSFEGDEIRIDSTGMAHFYDHRLPTFLKKYGKQWRATVGTATLPGTDPEAIASFVEYPDGINLLTSDGRVVGSAESKAAAEEAVQREQKTLPVHAIPITKEMRRSVVYGGQPQFGRAATKASELFDRIEADRMAQIRTRGNRLLVGGSGR